MLMQIPPLRLKLSNSINLQSVITITTLKFSIWDQTSRLHFALSLPLNRKIFNKAGHISLDSLIQQVESCLRMCRETWSKPFIANFWSSREWNARKNWNIIKNPGRRTQMAPSEWQARCQNHFTQFKTAKEEGGKLFKVTSAKLNKIGQWGNLSIKLSDLLTLGCHFEWPNFSFCESRYLLSFV